MTRRMIATEVKAKILAVLDDVAGGEEVELAVAAITWYELGWLAHHGRISVTIPVRR